MSVSIVRTHTENSCPINGAQCRATLLYIYILSVCSEYHWQVQNIKIVAVQAPAIEHQQQHSGKEKNKLTGSQPSDWYFPLHWIFIGSTLRIAPDWSVLTHLFFYTPCLVRHFKLIRKVHHCFDYKRCVLSPIVVGIEINRCIIDIYDMYQCS